MNTSRSISDRRSGEMLARSMSRKGFTMVELLVVVGIIVVLMGMMVAVVGSSMKTARTAATSALIQKIDVLLDERMKGFDRATKSADFQRIITARKQSLESGGIFGVSPDVLAIVARKDFFKSNFPQRYADFAPALTASGPLAGVPTRILMEPTLVPEDTNVNGVLDAGEDTNGNGVLDGYIHFKHKPETESSALLYFTVTRLQVFGVPPVGESEFGTSEVRDTDGDGLLEFVDGWGRPLRFYRWPTRLFKPNGIKGLDNQFGASGVDDDLNGTVDDLPDFGKVNTDDITVSTAQRAIAGYLIDGLPSGPVIAGQWDSLSEDPDDPYGLISTEIKRLFLQSNGATNVTLGVTGFNEMNYPTIDTYHTPLIVSVGADGDLGLFEPYQGTASGVSGAGVLDTDLGILAQPIHGPGGPYDFSSLAVTPSGNQATSALMDNITNRSRRSGKGK